MNDFDGLTCSELLELESDEIQNRVLPEPRDDFNRVHRLMAIAAFQKDVNKDWYAKFWDQYHLERSHSPGNASQN